MSILTFITHSVIGTGTRLMPTWLNNGRLKNIKKYIINCRLRLKEFKVNVHIR